MTQRRSFYLVVLIISLGFALRLYQLDARPFWFDENITVDLAAAPPGYVFDTIDRPPVYYLLLHIWTGIVGSSPFTLRFFSVWWGTLALVFFYHLAHQLVDRRLSLWALLLATFSPFYVYYAQEARTYALTLTLALISCWALLVWLKQRRARYLFLSAVATLGCLYTHYSLLLLPFAQTVFVLLTLWRNRQQSRPSFTTPIMLGLNFYVPFPHHLPKPKFKFSRKVSPLWQWLMVQALVAVLFLPWPIHARYGLRELFAPQANPSPFTVLQQVANFARMTLLEFSGSQSLLWPVGEAIALAFVGLIVLGLLSPALPKLSRRFLSIVLLLPPLIMLLLPRTAVYYAPKYLIMITPAFYILTVVGAEALWQTRAHFFTRRVAIALGVMLLIGVPALAIGWAAMLPFQADRTVQAFWSDDLQKPSAVNDFRNVAFADEGVTLSQLRVLPVGADYIVGIDTFGRIHLRSDFTKNFRYDLKSGMIQTIGGPEIRDGRIYGRSALTSDGKWYTVIEDLARQTHLTQFDPDTGITRDLGNVSGTSLLVGPDDQVYGLPDFSWPIFKYDPVQDRLTTLSFSSTNALGERPYVRNVLIGQDNWLYGTATSIYKIFALNLINGKLITRDPGLAVSALAPRSGGGVYINSGQTFWEFDASGTLKQLPAPSWERSFSNDFLTLRPNGHLVGRNTHAVGSPRWSASDPINPSYFFDYDPATGAFKRLHSSSYYVRDMIATADNDLYAITDNDFALIDSGQYTSTGYVESLPIHPVTLMFTRTVVGGDYASVQAVTCNQDGKVYGVKIDSATSKWLFSYDPQQPQPEAVQLAPAISTKGKEYFTAGTAIAPLKDGRLIGGTTNGHMFVYAPSTNEILDIGQPIQDEMRIASFAVDQTGIVYGGTYSYNWHAVLFSFDPATGSIRLIDLPFEQPRSVGAVTIGMNQHVYAGVDHNLVDYDPQTQRINIVRTFDAVDYYHSGGEQSSCTIRSLVTSTTGQIYGGCGSHLFVYDPAHGSLNDLGSTQEFGSSIASLTIGSDGRVYGSFEHEYMNRIAQYGASQIFVYDPTEQRMTNLGMDIGSGPVILTSCGDGTIYGGSNTTNSNYSGPAYLFAFRTDCPQGAIGSWDKVTWQAQTPPGTRLTVDVIGEKDTLVRNIQNGDSLQAIDATQTQTLRLRANLFTADPNVTPVLQNWRVDYTFACGSQSSSTQK